MKRTTHTSACLLTHAAMIAAIYTALTLLFAPLSFGPIQFRVSEVLCILPFFTPAAIPGVFVGCLLSNFVCGAPMPDVVFGSLATLIGAIGSYSLRGHRLLVWIPPVAANALIIPWVLRFAYGAPEMIPYMMMTVAAGEVIAVGVLGTILLVTLSRYRDLIFKRGRNPFFFIK